MQCILMCSTTMQSTVAELWKKEVGSSYVRGPKDGSTPVAHRDVVVVLQAIRAGTCMVEDVTVSNEWVPKFSIVYRSTYLR